MSVDESFSLLLLFPLLQELAMSQDELINCICEINRSAKREFLQSFSVEDLDEYLEHLMSLDLAEVGAA